MLSVVIRGSKHVVATRPIRAGEHLYRISGPVHTTPTSNSIPINKRQFREDERMGPYLCHSPFPNTYVNKIDVLVAIDDIAQGHEITVNRKPLRSLFRTQRPPRVLGFPDYLDNFPSFRKQAQM